MKLGKVPHNVVILVLDTNVLYADDHSQLIHAANLATLEECRKLENLRVVVPRIILHERLEQCSASARQFLAKTQHNAAALYELSGKNVTSQHNGKHIGRWVAKRLVDLLIRHSIAVQPLDFSSVAWHHLVSSAVRHLPPFSNETDGKDKTKEKGFKDSIALETIAQIADLYPRNRIILISDDERLAQAGEQRLPKKRFSRFKNLDEYRSELKLRIDESDVVAEKLERYVRERFYNEDDHKTLYYQMGLVNELEVQSAHRIAMEPRPLLDVRDDLPLSAFVLESYELFSERPKVRYDEVRYIQKQDNDTLIWSTLVGYQSLWKAFLGNTVIRYIAKTEWFQVVWRAVLVRDGQLINPAVNHTVWRNQEVRTATEGEMLDAL